MEERKRCIICKKPLISFQKHYLHPEELCSGLTDMINIEATITDEFLHKKFTDLYGSPKMDDYEKLNRIESNPIIRFLIRLFKIGGKNNE